MQASIRFRWSWSPAQHQRWARIDSSHPFLQTPVISSGMKTWPSAGQTERAWALAGKADTDLFWRGNVTTMVIMKHDVKEGKGIESEKGGPKAIHHGPLQQTRPGLALPLDFSIISTNILFFFLLSILTKFSLYCDQQNPNWSHILFLLAPVAIRTLLMENTEQTSVEWHADERIGHSLLGEVTGWQSAGPLIWTCFFRKCTKIALNLNASEIQKYFRQCIL